MHSTKKLSLIKAKTKALGFFECVLVPASPLPEEKKPFQNWLEAGMHGKMGYMARNVEKRFNPAQLVENAKTILIVLQNYYPEKTQQDIDAPVLSKYAYGIDYHFVMKEKLKQLLQFIRETIVPCNGRPFVDSAPVSERTWACKAGLGWIGKNSSLISARHGSFFFIGELILDAELPYDSPEIENDRCGTCTQCIDACPTNAITPGRMIDARKCISYQTIELKGELDQNLENKFNNRVFGCDICQDVCPWNRKASPHQEAALKPPGRLLELTRKEWHEMDKQLFNQLFKKSAVQRTGFKGLKRNLKFIG
jgi:epoxyqueuosine reductase